MFEYKNIPLHKNKSYSIIPLAIYNHFVHGTSIEDTVYYHGNIFDFCAGVKSKKSPVKGNSWYELRSLENNALKKEKLSKTVRYFISKKGKTLYKIYEDGSEAQVEAVTKRKRAIKDWKVTYFNKFYKKDKFEEYDIDHMYYIIAAKSIINDIEQQHQLTLF